ncbi:MAG: arginase family protein [Parcubacteria group bacterium]|nr:arginase family protein [Parcubacteria group bacterium]
MKTLNVVSVPYTHSGSKNISHTAGSARTPEAVKNLYRSWEKVGVRFLREDGSKASLNFLDRSISDFGAEAVLSFLPIVMKVGPEVGRKICFLGGDHSLSYFTVKTFRNLYGKNTGLIMLDAHPDLCDKGDPGNPYHSDWLRYLLDDRVFEPRQIFGIGWRDAEAEEYEFASKIGLDKILPMSALRFEDLFRYDPYHPSVHRQLALFCRDFEAVYLSIDMDVIDPAFAPGVNAISPGGLSSSHFIELMKSFSKVPQIKAFDITEINPDRDVNQMTQILAIKTMIEMA